MTTVPAVRVALKAGAADPPERPPPLAVRLPDLPTVPAPWHGAVYVVRSLLSSGADNPKLNKSDRSGRGFKTWGLALAPARVSGRQVCASASPGCRAACLFCQGHARLDPAIAACRIGKTVALREHTDWFRSRLMWELDRITRRAERDGVREPRPGRRVGI